jgi:hypothetical protein
LGIVYSALGQYEKAAEVARQIIPRAPDQVYLYENLAVYAAAFQMLALRTGSSFFTHHGPYHCPTNWSLLTLNQGDRRP